MNSWLTNFRLVLILSINTTNIGLSLTFIFLKKWIKTNFVQLVTDACCFRVSNDTFRYFRATQPGSEDAPQGSSPGTRSSYIYFPSTT
jgi:hypothetical protein